MNTTNEYLVIFGLSVLVIILLWFFSPSYEQPKSVSTPSQQTQQGIYNELKTQVTSSGYYNNALGFLRKYFSNI